MAWPDVTKGIGEVTDASDNRARVEIDLDAVKTPSANTTLSYVERALIAALHTAGYADPNKILDSWYVNRAAEINETNSLEAF